MAHVGNYDLVWRVVAGNGEIAERKAKKVDDEDVRNPQTSDVGRRLDLSMLSIEENWLSESLQQESFQYYSITVLNLNDCGLKSIPNFICNVTNVVRLRIHSNDLKTLPDTIGDLRYLERLSAYGNQLESLPRSLYKLRQLKILRLGGNKLHNRDLDRIQGMVGLQQLYLIQNQYITSIPRDLNLMDNLTELNADDCGNRALAPVPRWRGRAVQRLSKLPEPSRYEETRSSELTDETKPFAKALLDDRLCH
ncbi:leucine-rich repeat protein soc-2 homolog [Corticium candelabrum]|uniref:leucine-rich repeat protein soc-2 homolog n=1 Tax=Corticium candelabrum TaxID=121492 RepID=UPI002E271823|nr:leucine-rich repeat protein soc-2 homolog [Corticium candelabrum]